MGVVVFISILVLALFLMRWIMNLLVQKVLHHWLTVLLILIIGGVILFLVGFIAFVFGLAGYFGSALPPPRTVKITPHLQIPEFS